MLIVMAYLGGILTLLSPCILPVIPFLFAGKSRSFSTLALTLLGMALTFTAVSLLALVGSQWAIQANQWGRYIALAGLTLMALSLLSARLANRLLQPLLALGNRLDQQGRGQVGCLAPLLLGIATGLLWAPCAGPILGLIISSAILQGASEQTGILLLAYAGGCVTMLGLLLLASQRLSGFLRKKLALTARLRQLLGVTMLGSVALIATGSSASLLVQNTSSSINKLETHLVNRFAPSTQHSGLQNSPRVQAVSDVEPAAPSLPSLDGAVEWINSVPLSAEQLRGKVVLVDFWTFDCINCQHAIPYVRAWAEKYKDKGLVVIGVHTPEYGFERNIDNVRKAVKKLDLNYPIAVDNNYRIWQAFGNQYWPAHYYFDAKGVLRFYHFGEGSYEQQEQVIQKLLAEAKA